MDSRRNDPEGPGFPIRKSADQSLLATPRGLSQRATSFIASWCQGIHRMPLKRLILMTRHAQRQALHVFNGKTCASKTRREPPRRPAPARRSGTHRPGGQAPSSNKPIHDVNSPDRRRRAGRLKTRSAPKRFRRPPLQARKLWNVLDEMPPAGAVYPLGPVNSPDSTPQSPHPQSLVEVNGFEPSTSCLQSRRSPN